MTCDKCNVEEIYKKISLFGNDLLKTTDADWLKFKVQINANKCEGHYLDFSNDNLISTEEYVEMQNL